jgi:hypothetical protein
MLPHTSDRAARRHLGLSGPALKSSFPKRHVSELLPSHPGLNVAVGLYFRDARTLLDHGAKLNLVLNRRQVEVGHKVPSLLRVLDVTFLARDRVGALAALESKYNGSPGEQAVKGRANA